MRALPLAFTLLLVLASGPTPAAGAPSSQAECKPLADREAPGVGCPLDLSIPVRATLARGSDLHHWTITVPVSGRVIFEILPRRTVDLDLYVVTPQNTVIFAAKREGVSRELSTFVCEAPGEYQVYVEINASRTESRALNEIEYRLVAHASPEIAAALSAPTLGEGRPAAIHLRQVVAASFSTGSGLMATVSDDAAFRLWQPLTGGLVAVSPEGSGPVRFAAFSPDGQTLATGGRGGAVRFWSVGGGAIAQTGSRGEAADPQTPAPWVAFGADAASLAVARIPDSGGRELRTLEVWRAPEWASSARVDLDSTIVGLDYARNGSAVAATTRHTPGAGWSLNLYEAGGLSPIGALRGIDAGAANTVSVSPPVIDPSGQLVAVTNRFESPALEDVIRIWRVGASAFEREIRIPTQKDADLAAVAFGADGQTIVVLTGGPTVLRTYRLADGAELSSRQLRGRSELVLVSPDGRLAAAISGGTVRVASAVD